MRKNRSEWHTDTDFLRAHCREQQIEMTDSDYKRNELLKAQKAEWIAREGNWNAGFVLKFKGALGFKGQRIDSKADEEAHKAVRKFWNILDRRRYGKSGVASGSRYRRIGAMEKGKTGTNRHWNYIIDTEGESVRLFNARAKHLWEEEMGVGQLYVIGDVGIKWGVYGTKEITAFCSDTLDTQTTHL